MEPLLGTIQIFGFNFAPRGWTTCDGQLLPISSNAALFSLLGTMYGGDGRTTFGLPDLRSRAALHRGQSKYDYRLGSRGGSQTNVLVLNQMPAHNHEAVISGKARIKLGDDIGNSPNAKDSAFAWIVADDDDGSAGDKVYNFGSPTFAKNQYMNDGTIDTSGLSVAIGNAGASQPVNNMQPYLSINYCIALQGIYPPRS